MVITKKTADLLKIGALAFLMFGIPVTPAFAGTPDAICNWAGVPVNIDGNLDEWKNMPTAFFEDERLVLGISNDSDFLYLFFRTDNPDIIRAVRMTGLKLWFDARGKKNKDLEFHFRGGPSMQELAQAGLIDTGRLAGRMSDLMPPEFQQKDIADKIILTDKKLDLELVIPADGSQGPTVRYALEHGFCIFEIAVPLQDHLIDYYGFNAEPGQKIGIGAQWGGRADRGMKGGGLRGGMGGTGRMPPGGMGDGQGGTGGPPRGMGGMDMPEEKEVWIKTTLALPAVNQNEGD